MLTPRRMDVGELAEPDRGAVAVARNAEIDQVAVGEIGAGQHRRHAPVHRIEAVRHCRGNSRRLRRAADAGNLRHPVRLDRQLEAGLDDGGGDRVVAAAGAQRRDLALVIAVGVAERVLRQRRMMEFRFGEVGHGESVCTSRALIAAYGAFAPSRSGQRTRDVRPRKREPESALAASRRRLAIQAVGSAGRGGRDGLAVGSLRKRGFDKLLKSVPSGHAERAAYPNSSETGCNQIFGRPAIVRVERVCMRSSRMPCAMMPARPGIAGSTPVWSAGHQIRDSRKRYRRVAQSSTATGQSARLAISFDLDLTGTHVLLHHVAAVRMVRADRGIDARSRNLLKIALIERSGVFSCGRI